MWMSCDIVATVTLGEEIASAMWNCYFAFFASRSKTATSFVKVLLLIFHQNCITTISIAQTDKCFFIPKE